LEKWNIEILILVSPQLQYSITPTYYLTLRTSWLWRKSSLTGFCVLVLWWQSVSWRKKTTN